MKTCICPNCCDCGGHDCGCPGCSTCNMCEACAPDYVVTYRHSDGTESRIVVSASTDADARESARWTVGENCIEILSVDILE